MSEQLTRVQWDTIAEQLQAAFDPSDVDFRVQGKVNEQTGRAQVVAYVDARAVQERLDMAVGCGNWSFDWQPLVIDKGEVMVAKGTVTIYGVSKSDAGSASNFEQSLGAVSHCFKRAAVHWGVGRYLYNLPMNWVTVEKGGRIPPDVLRELRSKLPRPNGSRPALAVVHDEDAVASAQTTVLPAQAAAQPAESVKGPPLPGEWDELQARAINARIVADKPTFHREIALANGLDPKRGPWLAAGNGSRVELKRATDHLAGLKAARDATAAADTRSLEHVATPHVRP